MGAHTFPGVMPHGHIEEVFDDVFVLTGTVDFWPMFRVTRNMVIIRQDEELSLVNSIRLAPAEEAQLDKLGTVRNLFKLGSSHGMDDPYYVQRYRPTVWAHRDASHRGSVQTDKALNDASLPFDGNPFVFEKSVRPECALVIERSGGILISCDSVQNWNDFEGCSLPARGFLKAFEFAGPANVGPKWRQAMEPRGDTFESDFERLLEHDFRHLISAHGAPLRGSAKVDLGITVRRIYG